MTTARRGSSAASRERTPRPKAKLALRLYVAGSSPNSRAALANLNSLGRAALAGRYELEVIDVLRHPERALSDAVLVTPMLEKRSPGPSCRIFGNLDDAALVLRSLGISTVER